MKIVSGFLASRLIKVPKADNFRPSTMRIKEAIFSSLENRLDFKDITVLDLYSGSGALGIEAISRGAKHCDFVEKNKILVSALKNNLDSFKIETSFEVFNTNVEKYLEKCTSEYDLIFADPPYGLVNINQTFSFLSKNMNKSSIFVFEESKNAEDFNASFETGSKNGKIIFNKVYGDTKVSMVRL